jgi:hypothetical protein
VTLRIESLIHWAIDSLEESFDPEPQLRAQVRKRGDELPHPQCRPQILNRTISARFQLIP